MEKKENQIKARRQNRSELLIKLYDEYLNNTSLDNALELDLEQRSMMIDFFYLLDKGYLVQTDRNTSFIYYRLSDKGIDVAEDYKLKNFDSLCKD